MGLIFCTWADIFISKSWINLWTPVANVWNRMNAPVCSKGTEKVQQQLKDTMYASVSTQVLPSLLPSPCVSIYLFLCAVQHVEGGENAGMWAKDGRNIFFESTMTLWYPASGSFTVDKSPVSDESQKIENKKKRRTKAQFMFQSSSLLLLFYIINTKCVQCQVERHISIFLSDGLMFLLTRPFTSTSSLCRLFRLCEIALQFSFLEAQISYYWSPTL